MEPAQSPNHLIQKAQGGDRGAFDALTQRYSAPLTAFISARLGHGLAAKVEVQDLVQETFLQAWKSLKRFRGEGEDPFWAWLSTVAEHVVRGQARRYGRQKREAHREVSLQEPLRTPGGGFGELVDLLRKSVTSPSKELRRDERFERLRHALAQLTPDHRKVIFLARVRELHTDEVANRMDRSPAAVAMLLYRALLKLKEAFGATDSIHLPARSLEEDESTG